MNIPTVATATPNLSTLVSALQNNNLINTLSGAGPFTVFAPLNSAFTGANLPTNPTALRNLLLYHVVPGRYTSMDLAQRVGQSLTTIAGQPIKINSSNGMILLNNTPISQADIPASNGVIHTINSVLNPAGVSTVSPSVTPGTHTNNWTWLWWILLAILIILILIWLLNAVNHKGTDDANRY